MSYFLDFLGEIYYSFKYFFCLFSHINYFFLGVLEFDTSFHVVDFPRMDTDV